MNNEIKPFNDLEKMIRKMNKINKEKCLTLKSREKRKLNIKEKKLLQKQNIVDNEL
jgi:hypothetical protein